MSPRDHVVRLFASLACVLALVWGLTGCVEDAPPLDDDEGDGGPVADAGAGRDAAPAVACPAGWVEAEVGCVPRGTDVEGCGADRLTLADGRCGSAWVCPDGWARAPGRIECLPPEPAECPEGSFWVPGGEGCTEARPCPAGWMRAYGGCMPAPLAPCDGEPLPGGGCLNLPPVQARGCDGVEGLPAPGEACRPLPVDGCSEGPFDAGSWPAGTVFVRAGAADGDGSALRPFGTLDAALATVAPEGTVALGPGRYVAPTLTGPLTLRGRCARDVVLDGVLAVTAGATVELVDLSVEGGVDVEANARATLSKVQVEGLVERPALRIEGAAEATALRVSGDAGGVTVGSRGGLRCEDCVVDATREFGIRVERDGDAVLRDTVVLRVTPRAAFGAALDSSGTLDAVGLSVLQDPSVDQPQDFAAIQLTGGDAALRHVRLTEVPCGLRLQRASATVDDLDISRVRTYAVWMRVGEVKGNRWRIVEYPEVQWGAIQAFEGSVLELTGLLVLGDDGPFTLEESSGTIRDAVTISPRRSALLILGSRVNISQSRIEGSRILATPVGDSDASVQMSDVDMPRGWLSLHGGVGGNFELERVSIGQATRQFPTFEVFNGPIRIRDLFIEGSAPRLLVGGEQLDVQGVTLRTNRSTDDAEEEAGYVAAVGESAGDIRNLAISGSRTISLWVDQFTTERPRPSVRFRDVHIDASRMEADRPRRVGVWVDAADADFERLRVTGAAGPGLAVTRGATVTARRVALHDTGAAGEDGAGPAGLLVTGDSSATLEDLDVRRAVGNGVTVDGGRLTLDRAHVAELTPRPGGPPASAVLTVGGEVDLLNATLTTEGGPAVIARGGALTLHDVALEGGGVAALGGATVDAERVAVRGGAGALLATEAATVAARDLLVAGGDVAALSGAELRLSDALVEHPASVGLHADDATLAARNVSIAGGLAGPDAGCAWATDDATLTLDGARLRACGRVGLGVRGAAIVAANIDIEDGAGDGAGCDGGRLALGAFRIAGHAGAGVVARDCEAELTSGWLLSNAVAWLTGPGGRVRAADVVRRANATDTAVCTRDCPPAPSPPALPRPPTVAPIEAWPAP